jgi:hypothetical protein
MKRNQITCRCSAYPFPHRLSGGKCKLPKYVETYFYEDRTLCFNCSSNKTSYCEVAEGLESSSVCEKVIELESWHEIRFTK